MDCEFCNYNRNIEPQRIVYEDEDFMAFVSRKPVANGHCVLIPKEHSEFVSDIEDVKKMFTFVKYLSQAIKDAAGASHVKIETRYGNEGQNIKHTHIHLVPAFIDKTNYEKSKPISNVDERILENLRKSQWYDTLNG